MLAVSMVDVDGRTEPEQRITGYVSACEALTLTPPTGEPLNLTMLGVNGQIATCTYKGGKESKTSPMDVQCDRTKPTCVLQTELTACVVQSLSVLMFVLLSCTVQAHADTEPFRLNMCGDRTTPGWSFYCCEPEPVEQEKPELTAPEAVPQTSTPAAAEVSSETEQFYPATDTMMAYCAHVDELKYLAVLERTEENVRVYITEEQAMIDRAGAFTDQWQRVIFSSPELSVLDDLGIGEPLHRGDRSDRESPDHRR